MCCISTAKECQVSKIIIITYIIYSRNYPHERYKLYPTSCDLRRVLMRLKAKWNLYADQIELVITCLFHGYGFLLVYIRCYFTSNQLSLEYISYIPHCYISPRKVHHLRYDFTAVTHVRWVSQPDVLFSSFSCTAGISAHL